MQTASPCDASQDASTQTSDQLVSSLSLDVFPQCPHLISGCCCVQTLLPHNYSCSLTFFIRQMGRHRHKAVLVSALDRVNLVQIQRSSSAQGDIGSVSLPPLPHNYRSRTRTIPWTVPKLRSSVPAISTNCGSTCLAAAAARTRTVCPASRFQEVLPLMCFTWLTCYTCVRLLRPQLRSASSVTPQQSPVSTTLVGTHPVRSATSANKKC